MEPVSLDRAFRMFKPFTKTGLMVRVRLRTCARWNEAKDTFRTLRQRQRFYPSYWKKMPKRSGTISLPVRCRPGIFMSR